MKFIIIATFIFSSSSFAQTISLADLKKLIISKQSVLESINVGMAKKIITTTKAITDRGDCNYRITNIQSIIKIESDKMIVHSKEIFQPQNSPACQAAGYRPSEETILFNESKPDIQEELANLDTSESDIKTIVNNANIVTLGMVINEPLEDGTTYTDNLTVKYDLTKSLFKNLLLSQGKEFKLIGENIPDINPSTLDLSNIMFCENNDGDNSDCVMGNFSDILF